MPKVLVSLKNSEEAQMAASLGLDVLDFKDPSKGPMGGLTPNQLQSSLKCLDSGQMVSVACGELLEMVQVPFQFCSGVDFFKVGLSGVSLEDDSRWLEALQDLAKGLGEKNLSPCLVPVFYADHENASSPILHDGISLVLENGFRRVLVDTWNKNGCSLLDWISIVDLLEIQELIRSYQGMFVLAGSLTLSNCTSLLREGINPDWFGFRGAVCTEGLRGGRFDPQKALELVAGLRRLPI